MRIENDHIMSRLEVDKIAKGCIRTRSGVYVNVFEPDPETILIEDIAHALSFMPRWGGHTWSLEHPLSVAEHCLRVCERVPDELKLAGLLHDASEAYMMDLPKPIKRQMAEYIMVEDHLMEVIARKFDFDWPLHKLIKQADAEVADVEWNHFKIHDLVHPWNPVRARMEFMKLYNQITNRCQV